MVVAVARIDFEPEIDGVRPHLTVRAGAFPILLTQTVEDVGRQTPNLQLNMRQDLTTNVVIRGIGAYGDVLGVGFSIDNVPNFTDQTMRLEDVESVEILKGPQGTLYGAGALGGALRLIPNDPDVKAFAGSLEASGDRLDHSSGTGYTLTASATGPAAATSAAFNVTAGTATQLVFTVQPTSTSAGSAITPAVEVTAQDALGNTASGFTGNVAVAIGTNPSGGTLAGTTTIAAVGGVATFGNVSIDRAGVGYALTAGSTGLAGATSGAFNITPSTGTKLVFTVQPTSAAAGATITPAVPMRSSAALG